MQKKLTLKTNVSDLYLCRRCPRLLAKKLSGETNAWRVGLEGTSFCGKIFHDHIAAPFHRNAAKQSGLKKQREILTVFVDNVRDRQAMRKTFFEHVYRNYFFPYLVENSQTLISEQIDTFSKIIERWGDFLIDFFLGNPGFHDEPAVFANYAFSLPPEKNMKANFTAADGTVLSVGGRFDSALLDKTTGEVLLIEYKCRKETDPTEEIAQLALYAWLIHVNTGLQPRTCVLYLEEEQPAAFFSAGVTGDVISQFSSLFDCAVHVFRTFSLGMESIPKTDTPTLCRVCPYNEECNR